MTQTAVSYPPIEDYGVIGDCHTTALISSNGSIDWLCSPRFDSPSIFARLLDVHQGGFWHIQPTGSFQSVHRYVPNTNVLETVFTTDSGTVRLRDFMPVGSDADGTLRSARSVFRVLEGLSGEVEVESRCVPRPRYAATLPTFHPSGKQVAFNGFVLSGPIDWTLDKYNGTASCRITVSGTDRIGFALRNVSENDQPDLQKDVRDPFTELRSTIDYWQKWSDQCSYEGPYREAVIRSALVLKLLDYTPSGAIVAAATTSLPEQIGGARNWDYRFTWIRDASFTLYALLLAGFTDETVAFFNWIVRTVELERTGIECLYPVTADGDTRERILGYLSGYRNSQPVRIGNAAVRQRQLDVYGEVLDALHFATKAGHFDPGDLWDHFCPLVDWVADNWKPPGNGIWEVRGGDRNFVYAKVMAWVALDRGIKLAREHNLEGHFDHWIAQRDAIRSEVMTRGWSERLKAFKQSYEDDYLDASNLRMPIVGFIDGADPRMISTIDATLRHLVVDGLCYRYLDAPEGVPGSEAAFVICSFWLIDALMLAGRAEQAQKLYDEMLKHASPLGLYAEEIDPRTGAHLGNFPQAFSHIGVISAAVSLAHAGKEGSVSPQQAQAASRAGTGGGGQGPRSYSERKHAG